MDRTSLTTRGEGDQFERDRFNQWFQEEFEKETNLRAEHKINRMALIATKGTMDWAYPPFILASTASALGWEVSIFFSFYGLELLKKNLQLGVSPLGNPAMPMIRYSSSRPIRRRRESRRSIDRSLKTSRLYRPDPQAKILRAPTLFGKRKCDAVSSLTLS